MNELHCVNARNTQEMNPVAMKIGDYIETLESQQKDIIGLTKEIKYRLDDLPPQESSDKNSNNGYLLKLDAMTNKNVDLIQTLKNILEIL